MISGKTVEEWLASDRLGFLSLLAYRGERISDAELAVAAKWRHPITYDTILHIIFRDNWNLREENNEIGSFLIRKASRIVDNLVKFDYTILNCYNIYNQNFFEILLEDSSSHLNHRPTHYMLSALVESGCYFRAKPYDDFNTTPDAARQKLILNQFKEPFFDTYITAAINLIFANENINFFNQKDSLRALPIAFGHNDGSKAKLIFFEIFAQSHLYNHSFESYVKNKIRYFKIKSSNIAPNVLVAIQVILQHYCQSVLSDLDLESCTQQVKNAILRTKEIQHLVETGRTEQDLFKFLSYLSIVDGQRSCDNTVTLHLISSSRCAAKIHKEFMHHIMNAFFSHVDQDNVKRFASDADHFRAIIKESFENDTYPILTKFQEKGLRLNISNNKLKLSPQYSSNALDRLLHSAVHNEDIALIKYCLQQGYSPNVPNDCPALSAAKLPATKEMQALFDEYWFFSKTTLKRVQIAAAVICAAQVIVGVFSSPLCRHCIHGESNQYGVTSPLFLSCDLPIITTLLCCGSFAMTVVDMPGLLPDTISKINRNLSWLFGYHKEGELER